MARNLAVKTKMHWFDTFTIQRLMISAAALGGELLLPRGILLTFKELLRGHLIISQFFSERNVFGIGGRGFYRISYGNSQIALFIKTCPTYNILKRSSFLKLQVLVNTIHVVVHVAIVHSHVPMVHATYTPPFLNILLLKTALLFSKFIPMLLMINYFGNYAGIMRISKRDYSSASFKLIVV